MRGFGFLTDCFDEESLLRARLLARSLRHHDPGTPIGLITWTAAAVPEGAFDVVVDARNADPFRGRYRTFNKLVGVGWHAPFERGLFLDNDTIAVAPLREVVERHFAGLPFALNMARLPPDTPHLGMNHLDAGATARELDLPTVLDPDGGGHLYFEIPACRRLIQEAIDLALWQRELYLRLVGQDFMSDELAMTIVANRHGLAMPVLPSFVQCILSSFAADLRIDPRTFLAEDVAGDGAHWAGRRRLVHYCADGKWSGPYGVLARAALGVDYPPPQPGRVARLVRRVADRLGRAGR